MKNLKLGVKLIGSFVLTAFIVMIVGGTGLLQQDRLNHKAIDLGEQALPAVQDMLLIKSESTQAASIMRSLLTPYATMEQHKEAHRELDIVRENYQKVKKDFMTLEFFHEVEPEWKEFTTYLSSWVRMNNKVVELSQKLISMDMVNPGVLKDKMYTFEIVHQDLLIKVGTLVATGETFEGGTDGTTCVLAKWMENVDTTNPEIIELVEKIRLVHLGLHENVATIKRLQALGNHAEAKVVLTEQLYPNSKKFLDLVHQMSAKTDIAYNIFTEMNRLLLEEATVYQKKAFASINKMVDKADRKVDKAVAEGQKIAFTGIITTFTGIIAGTVLALILGFSLTALIRKPLTKGVDLSRSMAEGDLTKTMDVDQKDEIGVLARSLNAMAGNLRSMIMDIDKGVGSVENSSHQLAAIANQMSSGAEGMATRSNQVSLAADEMSVNQNSIASTMEKAAVNVNMVASAAEEMSVTINEIAQNSSKAKEVTTQAVNQSAEASNRVDELGKAANEIDNVTETITEISEQTNLLALNATIEAARAGEAGKGFAVVANEIKDLAKQTSEATLDIKNKIQDIQGATGITVREINEISNVISNVDQIVTTIAAAVEEQTATTKEIAENILQASEGITKVNDNVAQSTQASAEIAGDIAEVNNSANEMSEASSQVNESAQELSLVAQKLKGMMEKFIV